MKQGDTLVLLALVGGVLWLVSRKSSTTPPGGVTAPVTVEGGIASVQVASARQVASMGSHLIAKAPGTPIKVVVSWAANTKDGLSVPIAWRYKIVAQLGHNTIGGWQTAFQLGFNVPGRLETITPLIPAGSYTATFDFVAPNDPNQVWDVRTELFGAKVNSTGIAPVTGTADSDFTSLATGEHVGAVLTTGGVTVAGNISGVSVSQHSQHNPLLR